MEYEVIVEAKKEVLDPEGRAIQETLEKAGVNGLAGVEVSKRYLIRLKHCDEPQAADEAHQIAKKHLANPVAETYRIKKV